MNVREVLEQEEHSRLSRLAAFSNESRGRLRPEDGDVQDVRTNFQRDIDRIVHCK